MTKKGGADQVVKDVSNDHQTGTFAVRVAQSDPLTVGLSDHFDSVAQKHLPLGAELKLALNLIPSYSARDRHWRGVGFPYPFCASG